MPLTQMQDFINRDLAVLWHPCTQMKDHEALIPLIPIRRGEGVWLEDYAGRRYLDAISSWWVNLFGHANPHINAAIKQQLDQLEHVMLAGYSHEPALLLAEKLVALTPPGLNRCFYADNGSSGIEVALKMSFHYWHNIGQPRKTKFLTLEQGYHGETLGALALGNVALYKDTYGPLLMQAITAPSPDCSLLTREPGETCDDHARRQFDALEILLARHADELCAVILEPLVQCASGMRMHPPAYLRWLRDACDRHNVHLIADEIAVGFGRTGTLFACEQAAISPDFICLSKGLTGGYLPLCAVLTHEHIYQAFYDDYQKLTAFLHSHSYTGNPLACRAALATLEIFETSPSTPLRASPMDTFGASPVTTRGASSVLEHNRLLAQRMADSTAHLQDHPHVAEVRQTGMILAIEMVKDKAARLPYPWQERRGLQVYNYALSQGALLRPLGNVVYFMPPYVITPEQIDWLAAIATAGITQATQ